MQSVNVIPPEWSPHEAVWLAWPSHLELWEHLLRSAQTEFVELCRGIADPDESSTPRGERLEILVRTAEDQVAAEAALSGLNARFHRAPYGDIWLRDTAPVFSIQAESADAPEVRTLRANRFRFNGWGSKFELEGDQQVGRFVADASGPKTIRVEAPLTTEGGALEFDGEGTLLTTRSCLLNANRNPDLTESSAETILRQTLGVDRVLWLDGCLLNDHTDGHIDTLARFVAPGEVVCMGPTEDADPNTEMLGSVRAALSRMVDARGRMLTVHTVPSPGRVDAPDGSPMPASYVNFYIANRTVIVPTYGVSSDALAVEVLQTLFPDRRVIGSTALAILHGGGAFHCITQQQPRVP